MKEENLQYIKEDLVNLKKMSNSLQYSYRLCKKINIGNNLTDEEYLYFDSLTSRFSRLSDIIIQKVMRTIDLLNLEDSGTIRDRLNRAEKNGLISNIDEFVGIRKLRNDITHEYMQDELIEIYKQVLKYTPVLKKTVKRITQYCITKYKL